MLSLSGSESTLLAGQQRFLERRISHLPLWPSFTADPCHATLEQKLPLLSSTMKNRYCIVSAVGFFHGQLHFLPRVWPVCDCESAGQGQIITLLLRPRPSAPLVRFQCETFPSPALPDWLLVSLLDRGQLKLGANCSLCWPLGLQCGRDS